MNFKRLYIIILGMVSCVYHDTDPPSFDCSLSGLTIKKITASEASSCAASDGTVLVSATGGKGDYLYSINDGTKQSDSTFKNLATGIYNITVTDAQECSTSMPVSVNSAESTIKVTLSSTVDSGCPLPNGTLTVNATGGNGSYMFKINSGTFQTENVFTGVAFGSHSVTVQDTTGCPTQVIATIERDGPKFTSDIAKIFNTKCAISGCHNGSRSPNLNTYNDIKNNGSRIKNEISSKAMPPVSSAGGSLSQNQINAINCWIKDGTPNN
jgi:hypothetical protein